MTLTEAPVPPADEWPTSSPAEQGINGELLSQLRQHLISGAPNIRSVLVVRHGKLVFEHYAQQARQDELHHVYSVTKSYISALIGIAIDRGFIGGVSQPISEFFPETLATDVDPVVRHLTIANLLSMTSGLEWDGKAHLACGSSLEGPCAKFRIDSDLVNFAIQRPIAHLPGTFFNYDNYSSHLLSVLISRATGMKAAEFAEQYLFKPLGVHSYRWDIDRHGNNMGGWGLYMRSRDLAKLGQLYLDKGAWHGKQLVPSNFVMESTRQHSAGGWPGGVSYGYQWWVSQKSEAQKTFFAALGYGGQAILVFPNLDMVVVIASDKAEIREGYLITMKYIVPSAKLDSD